MRISARLAVVVSALFAAGPAFADPYDIRIVKLGNPEEGEARHDPAANAKFRAFARQFAAALTSANLQPPETLGHAGFAVNIEGSFVGINQDEVTIPTERLNDERPGLEGGMWIPSVHIRKGLPWSFETGARIAWIEKSQMFAATGEVKWALNEGFAYLPDIGIRGHATRLFNTRDFDLTAVGADLGIGKQFAIGGMVTLTPYVGWNLVWVAANSNVIDFRPERTYAESVATRDAQFTDTGSFDEVSLGDNAHNRFYGGVRFIAGAFQLGVEGSLSQIPGLPTVRAINFTAGLDF